MPAFLKLGGVQGEGTDADHKDWIIIDSLSAAIFRSIPAGARDQQRTKGDTALADVVCVRQLDKSSTKLQEACANGTFFKEAQIDFCTTVGNRQEPYLTYKLADVIVSSYSMHAVASGMPLPSEEITLAYTTVEWTYIVVDPKTGNSAGRVAAAYNPAEGRS